MLSWCFLAGLKGELGPGRRGRAPLSSEVFLTSQDGLQLCSVTEFVAKSEVNLQFGFLHGLARVISLEFVIASRRQQTLSSPRLSYSTPFFERPWPSGARVAVAELLGWLFFKGKSEILFPLWAGTAQRQWAVLWWISEVCHELCTVWGVPWAVHRSWGGREGRRRQCLACDAPHHDPEPPVTQTERAQWPRPQLGSKGWSPSSCRFPRPAFLVQFECLLHRNIGERKKNPKLC